jgi:Protein of unknown function (DUF4232)
MRTIRLLVAMASAATTAALLATPQAIAAAPNDFASRTRAVHPCAGADLHVTLGRREGAAGTIYQNVKFQNTGNTTCTVKGYPNTSFRTAKGKLVGPPSSHDNFTGVPVHRLTLKAGGFAHTAVAIPEAANFPVSQCKPHKTAKLRVTAPKRAIATVFPYHTTICTIGNGTTRVGPLRKGPHPG